MPRVTTEVDKRIGKLLAEKRRLVGSQAAAGKPLGLSYQQIQKYENGTNRLSVATLIELSRVLGFSASQFLREIEVLNIVASAGTPQKAATEYRRSVSDGW